MNATRTPTGGPDDLEALLRTELGAVADAVGADGRPAPASAALARGRTAKRRRRAALSGVAALATAAVVALGFTVTPADRADPEPALPSPTAPDPSALVLPPPSSDAATPQQIVDWVTALPVGPVPEIPRSKEGVVAWGSTATALPKISGLSRFAYGFGLSDRGLLVGWPEEPDASSVRLGWLSADGRWTVVDRLAVSDARVSPDGKQYVVVGKPLSGPRKGQRLVVVRTTADDSVLTQTEVPQDTAVKGWFDGGWLLTAADGTKPMVLREATLEPRDDLIPLAPTGEPVVGVTSVQTDVVEYTAPSVEGCPSVDGSPTVMTLANRYDNGKEIGRVPLGCLFGDSEVVSADGRSFVRGLDELTVRSMATQAPLGPVGPPLPAGAAVVQWEPDGRHVQIEIIVTTPAEEFRNVVRCSAADGSCVRAR